MTVVRVGIVGATGYVGRELISWLLRHPQVRLTYLGSQSAKGRVISDVFYAFKECCEIVCEAPDVDKIAQKCDVVFLALPHTMSLKFVPALMKTSVRVIDLSADYRLNDTRQYEKYYHHKHSDKSHLVCAVYGLTELYRQRIKGARLVANPGCYPTVSILTLAPLVAFGYVQEDFIVIDAKSGVSGAGKKLQEEFLFGEVNENFRAYKVGVHQHIPEIKQELEKLAGKKLGIYFVPHLLPLQRGILITVYAKKKKELTSSQSLTRLYQKFYKKEPFVRIRQEGESPQLQDVVNTNFCDIGIKEIDDGFVLIGAIDNLVKGAAGQAIQNMNVMCEFPETTGLK